ncbi:MAG: hypothetical protein HFJ65_00845 [Eggerthellaceae bacterium]|nr:hypothetical protein [Eggerthellaceae bacterium]
MELYDMHCHLDFADEAEAIAKASADAGITALVNTVIPSSYVSDLEKFKGHENIYLSLGIHPWWVGDKRVGEADIDHFETLLPDARFIGEIGLDLANKHKDSLQDQVQVLRRILADIQDAGAGRVITFHAVHAATYLLDMLDELDVAQKNTCIFHWFQGSHEEFGRALATGAMMSVCMRMMATDAGAKFAAAIPDEQLLAETDSPPHEGSEWDVGTWKQELENTMAGLAEVRGCSKEHVIQTTSENSKRLLS